MGVNFHCEKQMMKDGEMLPMNKNLSKIIANNMIKNESTKQSELIKNDNQFTLEYKHRRIGYLQRKRKKKQLARD